MEKAILSKNVSGADRGLTSVSSLQGRRYARWREWLLRFVGLAFIVSAIINTFGFGENIPQIFAAMAEANEQTRLAGISSLIAGHPMTALLIATTFMFVTGLTEILVLPIASLAAISQVVLMLVYITLLHRAFPEVILTDGLLILAIAVALVGPERDMAR